ncbi:hypothetical protein SUSAZ_04990 [Sulfolobus acidocaldarius SUSAZ]|nr:hypothetical protein SUSAZ_04990 [Sulfolobus acidocaldarius SUSAZ]
MAKNCPRCGKSVPDDARYCYSCGYYFGSVQVPKQDTPVTVSAMASYIPRLLKIGKLILGISIIFAAIAGIVFLSHLIQLNPSGGIISGSIIGILGLIAYLISPIFSMFRADLSVNKISILTGLGFYFLIGLSSIIISISTPISFPFGVAGGIVVILGVILTLISGYIAEGNKLVKVILQMIGVILIYVYTYSTGRFLVVNYESTLWGVAVILALVPSLVSSISEGELIAVDNPMTKGEVGELINNSMLGLGLLIFSIGMVLTGSVQVSFPPSPGLLDAVYALSITSGILAIVGGIIGLILSIFVIIYIMTNRKMPKM